MPTGTPIGADAVGAEKPPGNVKAGKPGAVREHAVAVDLLLANRHDEPPLMRIEHRVQRVRRHHGHHGLAQLVAAREHLLIFR